MMRDFTRHPRLRVLSLGLVAWGAAVFGVTCFLVPSSGTATFVAKMVPLHVWGSVWLAAAALVLVGVLDRIVARFAVNVVASLWAVWGLSYLSSVFDPAILSRVWALGCLMLVLAGHSWVAAMLIDATGPRRWRDSRQRMG